MYSDISFCLLVILYEGYVYSDISFCWFAILYEGNVMVVGNCV